MYVIAILIALGTGLFVGSRFEGAHDAHQRFSRYRVQTNASLGTWLKKAVIALIAAIALIILLYLLLHRSR
jgi:cytochrome c oxidase assembly factor CtaG